MIDSAADLFARGVPWAGLGGDALAYALALVAQLLLPDGL